MAKIGTGGRGRKSKDLAREHRRRVISPPPPNQAIPVASELTRAATDQSEGVSYLAGSSKPTTEITEKRRDRTSGPQKAGEPLDLCRRRPLGEQAFPKSAFLPSCLNESRLPQWQR